MWISREHLFISLQDAPSIHPSRLQFLSHTLPYPPHPLNISARCLHKVQMKSLITHSPIGSCLRIIERVAAVALTFFLPPRHLLLLAGMPVYWYEWAVGCVYMCCAAAGTRLMKRSRRIVVVGGWVGVLGGAGRPREGGLPSLAFSWEVFVSGAAMNPSPKARAVGWWGWGVGGQG